MRILRQLFLRSAPFFQRECKGKTLYFINQIFLIFLTGFSFEKPPFLIGSAKVRAIIYPSKFFFKIVKIFRGISWRDFLRTMLFFQKRTAKIVSIAVLPKLF